MILKFVHVLEVLDHVEDIIVASCEFTVLTDVIDSNQYGTFGTIEFFDIGGQIKFGIHLEGSGGGKLGNLGETLFI